MDRHDGFGIMNGEVDSDVTWHDKDSPPSGGPLPLTYLPCHVASVEASISRHADYTLARRKEHPDASVIYNATALSVMERLIENWADTQECYKEADPKIVYYLSLEFLVGRSLQNAVYNLGLKGEYRDALMRLGYSLEEAVEEERDPALGNGGLGRLASCFMDSLATLNYPAWGYGIRYKYGMFEQRIEGKRQVEYPDYWLSRGNPWEVPRHYVKYPVRFYGHVTSSTDGQKSRFKWEGGEIFMAVAYDTPVSGYETINTNTMRLWASQPSEEFDLQTFNAGHHVSAVESQARAEAISSVLYPNDNTDAGRELRLKQQFFFVSATLQDILLRYKATGRPLTEFHTKVAVQLNDTHPTIAIPELMRLLVDEEDMEWIDAWSIVVQTFGYTNHTILPEALEKWSVPLVQHLLPRHMEIIYEINHRHLQEVESKWKGDLARMSRMSIIEESQPKMVRMAVLATVGSHCVNGVAQIHTNLVKSRLFPEFLELTPQKFQNKTNGVTPRRWMLVTNPSLSEVISRWLQARDWLTDPALLQGLIAHADNPQLQNQWRAAKQKNKARLASFILKTCGVKVQETALFDVHAKRIHEYKRQLLNILSCIHRYNLIKASTEEERAELVPRVTIFAGKAAAGYFLAKCTIHLINSVADTINNDPEIGDLLKVVFIPNYNVSAAEVIIPASDISQHISTAGMEASGTSNMKFVMNGGLILGTMDGANIEIADAIGREQMFIFGALAEETDSLRHALRYRQSVADERLQQVFRTIEGGVFGSVEDFQPILDSVRQNDYFLLVHDWPSYLDAQQAVEAKFCRPSAWTRHCILSTSMMGRFSSDRTIQEYARDIWDLKPVPVKR